MVDTATPHTTDLFIGLTPDRVLQAVERAGLACRPVCYPLNSFENRVYEVELEDRARVVAKFYRPGRWTEAQILEEHRLLDALAAAEVPVCTMRPFPDGGALRQIDGIYYSVADRRGGRAPDELSDALVLRLGRLIGRMHTVAAARPGDDVDRPRLDADRYVRRPLAWMRTNDVIPPSFRQRYAAAAETIADRADALMLGVPTQLVHGDLHLGNLLLRDDRLNVLDFDDCCIGPAVQDLWLVLPGRGPEADRHRALL
ncbi:MAG: serine/threonine protein kinase, partial [Acidobacteriota bacterium]